MSLASLLDAPATRIEEIAAWLDERTHAERVDATRSLTRAQQRTLYTRASLALRTAKGESCRGGGQNRRYAR